MHHPLQAYSGYIRLRFKPDEMRKISPSFLLFRIEGLRDRVRK